MQAQASVVRAIVAIATAFVILSCGSDSPQQPTPLPNLPPPPVSLARVEIRAPESIDLQRSMQLSATAVRSDGTSEDVTSQAQWSSANPSVVSVSGSGEATAVQAGEATITARYQNRTGSALIAGLPAGTHKLTGVVTENGRTVDGVLVTVISGVGTGRASTTGGGGRFNLFGVAGHVTLQAKRDGYLNKLVEVDVNGTTTHNFEVLLTRPRLNLAGDYILSLQAGASCASGPAALPESVRRRTYEATIEQNGPDLSLRVNGPDVVVTTGQGNTFNGVLDLNDTVSLQFGSYYYYYYYYGPITASGIVERLSPTTELVISGTVSARASSSAIVGRLTGIFLQREDRFRVTTVCSSDHTFDMRRK
jgi:hypothetical protein